MLKKIANSKIGLIIIPWILFMVLKLLEYTSRKKFTVHPDSQELMDNKKPFVAVLLHSRLLMMYLIMPKGLNFGVLTSSNRDGILIGKFLNKMGMENFYGSSTRDGTKALLQIKQWIAQGNSIGTGVDGPRGPAYKTKPGAVFLAKELQVPILPISYSSKKGKFLDTWDCFLRPSLFDSYEFEVGEPIYLDDNIKIRDTLKLIDSKLLAVTNNVDSKCGKITPTPSKEKAEKALRRERRLKAEQREKNRSEEISEDISKEKSE